MTAPAETPSWSRGTNPVDTSAPPTPADMPQTQEPPVAAAPTEPPAETGAPDGQPEDSSQVVKLRQEAAKYRTERNEQKTAREAAEKAAQDRAAEATSLKDILTKLNSVLNPGADTPPDPAQLAEQLTAAQAETARIAAEKDQAIRDLTIKATLPGIAAKVNANLDGVQDFLIASGALSKLNPSADTFTADLESAVAAALDARPHLKNAPVTRKNAAEIPGRSGGSEQLTIDQVRAMKPEQIEEARKAGRLRNLLGG